MAATPSAPRVVITEPFSETGVAVLRDHGIDVVSLVGRPPDELAAALAEADGLIVRSETRVDRALLACGPKLVVVARAGVGVDAIDVDAATDAGIVVLNTPGANTIAATEQTFALMLSLARHTPAAALSLREGRWERKPFIGTELAGKTLGIVGLGRIGGNVATRAQAFGMTVLASDPFITQARADGFGVELTTLDDLLARADVVTLHVPLTQQTIGMIDRSKLALLRPHAYIVNCARGGVIVEDDLLDALDRGVLAAAAIDVVAKEPPPPDGSGAKLHRHPKVVATPHLGGSTVEALERIAIELAHDVASVLLGGPASAAVNAPIADGPDAEGVRPFVDVAYRLGKFHPQILVDTNLPPLTLVLEGRIAETDPAPILTAFLAGLLQTVTDRRISIVNAASVAAELGIRVDVAPAQGGASGVYASSLRLSGGGTTIVATSALGEARVVRIDGFAIDATLGGAMLLTEHHDVPGMIGKIGTILGEADVNISRMTVSREDVGGDAMMVLATDRRVDAPTLDRIRAIGGFRIVRAIDLG